MYGSTTTTIALVYKSSPHPPRDGVISRGGFRGAKGAVAPPSLY